MALVGLGLTTVECASTANADELVIAPEIQAELEEYLHQLKPLAFAVSADGTHAGWIYCEGRRCDPSKDYRSLAIGQCTQVGGRNCMILAVGSDVKLDYRVDPSLAMTSPSEPPPPPAATYVTRRLDVRGPSACIVTTEPTEFVEYQAVRQQLDECWLARIEMAHYLCNKKQKRRTDYPCYDADDAEKYRRTALQTLDANWN